LTWWLRNSRAEIGVADGQPEPDTGPAPTPEERAQQRNLDSQTTGEILGPDGKPITVLMAAGLGKQRLYVLPQYDMVIVRFGELRSENRGFDDREFLGRVLGMVGEDSGDKKK
nr:hypothetical protein [Phycisphaerales bacterium]